MGIYYALVISLRHIYSHAVAWLIANCRTYYNSLNNVYKRKNNVMKKKNLPMRPRYHTKQNENYYTISRNLSKIFNLFTCSEVPFPPPPPLLLPPLISLLPVLLPSPMPYNSPFSPPTTNFTPTTLLSPVTYHCQSESITNSPLNYNATATATPPFPTYQLPWPHLWWLPTII